MHEGGERKKSSKLRIEKREARGKENQVLFLRSRTCGNIESLKTVHRFLRIIPKGCFVISKGYRVSFIYLRRKENLEIQVIKRENLRTVSKIKKVLELLPRVVS